MDLDIKLNSLAKRAAAVAAFLVCVVLFAVSISTLFGNAIARAAPEPAAAEFAAQLAPNEPQAYFRSAELLERSMRAGDLPLSLTMYETAAALEPNDYLIWLELGRAKERNGDPEGAELALRHAAAVAPSYSEVNWSLGNVLIRNGKDKEGFSFVRKAVENNPKFARPAASLAWDLFEGDIAEVTKAIGDSRAVKASMAGFLAKQEKFDEALAIWKSIPAAEIRSEYAEAGKQMFDAFFAAKRFRAAASILAQLVDNGPKPATVTNGGFEEDVSQKAGNPFDWSIASGNEPQIGISVEQKKAGERSLAVIFGEKKTRAFRQIGQVVAVEPGIEYEFAAFYKSSLDTEKTMKWQAVDAVTNEVIASSEPLAPNSDWAQVTVRFSTEGGVDGVVIRLVRDDCTYSECDISGRLWLDEVGVRRIQ